MDRVKEWEDKEVLTHSELNAEFDNITDNVESGADITDVANVAEVIHGATAKTTPVNADELGLVDSAAANVLKKLTWTNVKATFKTYFDTLYNMYTHPNHSGEVTSVADGAATITNKAVTLAKMNDMATASILGRNTAATGVPEVLSKATTLSLLNVEDGADVTDATNVLAHAAAKGANADITSMTALTQITRATGGAFDIAIGESVGDDFTVDTNKLVVEGDTGNVGIGTDNPQQLLEVRKDQNSYSRLSINNANTGGSAGTNLRFYRGGTIVAGNWYDNSTKKYYVHAQEANSDLFLGAGGGTGHEKITIKSSGNIGISTTTPGGKLCINGGVTVGSDTDAGDNNLRVEGTADIIGQLNMNTQKIVGVVDPTANQEASTKKYVDDNDHTQGTDADLDATFEATFVKKADTVNVLSDITSTGANIEDAVTKKHTATLIGTKTIDETDIANTKVIAYNSTSGNLEYESAGTADAHAATHVTGGGDTIANVVAAGNAGLMTGADKTKLNGIEALYAVLGANADITSVTALTQVTRATGGAFDIAIGSAAGDDFTVDTNKLVVEGDTGNIGIGTTSPAELLNIESTGDTGLSIISGTTQDSRLCFGDPDSHFQGQIRYDNNLDNLYLYAGGAIRQTIKSNGNIGIGIISPNGKLCIDGGLTVGSDTDAGDNNLRVEGTVNIIGQLNMNTQKIVGVVDPTANQEAATKKYVDDNSGSGLTWSVISANTNAAVGHGYFINASGGNVTLTLPASPSIGNTIAVCDFYNKATTNTITIARNTKNIEGVAENLIININGAGFTMVYSDTTRGWEIVTEI